MIEWSGLCNAEKHGLDYRGQRCDLCLKEPSMTTLDGLSLRGRQLAGAVAKNLELVQEHGKDHPGEALVLAIFLLAHIRNTWPQALVSLKDIP